MTSFGGTSLLLRPKSDWKKYLAIFPAPSPPPLEHSHLRTMGDVLLRKAGYVQISTSYVVHRSMLHLYDSKKPASHWRLDGASYEVVANELGMVCRTVPEEALLEKEERVKLLEAENRGLGAKCEGLEQSAEVTKIAMAGLRTKTDERIIQLEAESRGSRERCSALESRASATKAIMEGLRTTINGRIRQLEASHQILYESQGRERELETENKMLKWRCQGLEENEKARCRGSEESERAKNLTTLAEKQANIRSLGVENDNLSALLLMREETMRKLETENAVLKIRIEKLEDSGMTGATTLSVEKERVRELEIENVCLRSKCEELEEKERKREMILAEDKDKRYNELEADLAALILRCEALEESEMVEETNLILEDNERIRQLETDNARLENRCEELEEVESKREKLMKKFGLDVTEVRMKIAANITSLGHLCESFDEMGRPRAKDLSKEELQLVLYRPFKPEADSAALRYRFGKPEEKDRAWEMTMLSGDLALPNGPPLSRKDWKAVAMVYYIPYGALVLVLLAATISGLPNAVGRVLTELCLSMD